MVNVPEPVPDTVLRDALTGAGGNAIVALATGMSGPGALITAVGAFAVGAMPLVYSELRSKGQRVDAMAAAAVEVAGAAEPLITRAADDEQARALLTDAIEAAANNRFPPSLRAIGRAMAGGLLDDGTLLDDHRELVEALRAVERPHFIVMWALREPSDVPAEGGGEAWFTPVLRRDELRAKLPESFATSMDRLLATLEREGLVGRGDSPETFPTAGGTRPLIRGRQDVYWALTDFGLRALAAVRRAGATEPD